LAVTVPLAVVTGRVDVGVRGTIASIRGDLAEVAERRDSAFRIPVARLRPSRERAPEEQSGRSRPAAARGDVSNQLDVRGLQARRRASRCDASSTTPPSPG